MRFPPGTRFPECDVRRQCAGHRVDSLCQAGAAARSRARTHPRSEIRRAPSFTLDTDMRADSCCALGSSVSRVLPERRLGTSIVRVADDSGRSPTPHSPYRRLGTVSGNGTLRALFG
jgi:hypothetical protein